MITRPATQVVAESTIPRSATWWRPGALPEGPAKRDEGSGGDARPPRYNEGPPHPATGSHLPSEETAPPSAVAPFASSPFAHSIPQSRRRAYHDLLRGSLSMPILRVALDVPLNTLFDYLAPNGDVTDQDVGAWVRVPFGKRVVTGVIIEVS